MFVDGSSKFELSIKKYSFVNFRIFSTKMCPSFGKPQGAMFVFIINTLSSNPRGTLKVAAKDSASRDIYIYNM